MEIRVQTTGYLQAAFWNGLDAAEYVKYGPRILNYTTGSVHDHIILYKVMNMERRESFDFPWPHVLSLPLIYLSVKFRYYSFAIPSFHRSTLMSPALPTTLTWLVRFSRV